MSNKVWAHLNSAGAVDEVVTIDASLVPGKNIYTPAFAANLVDVTTVSGIAVGWVQSGAGFAAAAATAPTAAALIAYAGEKQVALRDGGITVNVGSASTPDEVNVASDVNGRSLVTGCVQLVGLASQNSQPTPTFPWINNSGTQLLLTAAQMMTIGYQLGAFVQATYSTLGAVLAAISAGTITSTAQIDAPPSTIATWPATSY